MYSARLRQEDKCSPTQNEPFFPLSKSCNCDRQPWPPAHPLRVYNHLTVHASSPREAELAHAVGTRARRKVCCATFSVRRPTVFRSTQLEVHDWRSSRASQPETDRGYSYPPLYSLRSRWDRLDLGHWSVLKWPEVTAKWSRSREPPQSRLVIIDTLRDECDKRFPTLTET